ncbi:MAG: hypothetical protein COA47_06955 [Robiginitomaculum sp.]|nr:MAG: hypothetical protein COA47_06955 [Robiginitomaculum sp.]
MIFLLNDVLLDIKQPNEIIRSDGFPISTAEFAKMSLADITGLAFEEFYKDLNLARTQPEKAGHLAVLLAAKTRANAALIGPPTQGARQPSEMAVRFADVSLLTLSHLYQLQLGGTLQTSQVQEAVWQALSE